jgi:hypothetical protein
MTQELITNMLGVRREGVTEAALSLQQAGLTAASPEDCNDPDSCKTMPPKCLRTFRCVRWSLREPVAHTFLL